MIEDKMVTLRQVVARAKEAKANGWSREGMNPKYEGTSPGELYEYLIKYFDILVNEIEDLIENIGGNIGV